MNSPRSASEQGVQRAVELVRRCAASDETGREWVNRWRSAAAAPLNIEAWSAVEREVADLGLVPVARSGLLDDLRYAAFAYACERFRDTPKPLSVDGQEATLLTHAEALLRSMQAVGRADWNVAAADWVKGLQRWVRLAKESHLTGNPIPMNPLPAGSLKVAQPSKPFTTQTLGTMYSTPDERRARIVTKPRDEQTPRLLLTIDACLNAVRADWRGTGRKSAGEGLLHAIAGACGYVREESTVMKLLQRLKRDAVRVETTNPIDLGGRATFELPNRRSDADDGYLFLRCGEHPRKFLFKHGWEASLNGA